MRIAVYTLGLAAFSFIAVPVTFEAMQQGLDLWSFFNIGALILIFCSVSVLYFSKFGQKKLEEVVVKEPSLDAGARPRPAPSKLYGGPIVEERVQEFTWENFDIEPNSNVEEDLDIILDDLPGLAQIKYRYTELKTVEEAASFLNSDFIEHVLKITDDFVGSPVRIWYKVKDETN